MLDESIKIEIYSPLGSLDTAHIVQRAFQRSFTMNQVSEVNKLENYCSSNIVVCINPGNEILPFSPTNVGRNKKILLFGEIGSELANLLNFKEVSIPDVKQLASIEACKNSFSAETQGFIEYTKHKLAKESPIQKRALCRFDFEDEWNNLGYGKINLDESPWGINCFYLADESYCVAYLKNEKEIISTYISISDFKETSILWCARPVGPVDSLEWVVIERFLSDYRPELQCIPYLLQTPKDFSAVATMRLDCDEDIASARPLFNLYQEKSIPFSLAIKTSLNNSSKHLSLMKDVKNSGGSLVSHTHRHLNNWGSNYQEALADAKYSRNWFSKQYPDEEPPSVAVSPFHSNPPYAMQAILDAGFTGVVSGIIHNDPEFLIARAGVVPFINTELVTISQQCMLHGDSFKNQLCGITIYIEALKNSMAGRGIFGYLDHPFSSRYWYGWDSEEQRIKAHRELLDFIKQHPDILFLNLQNCFYFVHLLMQTSLSIDENENITAISPESSFVLEYHYHGKNFTIP